MKVCVYLWIMEAVRLGNGIYSDTWAKAILSRDKISEGRFETMSDGLKSLIY